MSSVCDSDSHNIEREELLSGLLAAVKGCQVRFGGRAELATETDERVAGLCDRLEATLSHGLKPRTPGRGLAAIKQIGRMTSGLNLNLSLPGADAETPVLWWFVRELLTRHEYERFLVLRCVSTDLGRGRAWLRSLLNEHALERYMHILGGDDELLKQYYEPWALLRDQERAAMLPNLAAGLDSILFAIIIDNPELNGPCEGGEGNINPKVPSTTPPLPEPEAHIATPPPDQISHDDNTGNGGKKREVKKKRRKIPSQLISFDDDLSRPEDGRPEPSTNSPLYHSAPTTCLSSPSPAISSTATPYADRLEKLVHLRELQQAKEALRTSIDTSGNGKENQSRKLNTGNEREAQKSSPHREGQSKNMGNSGDKLKREEYMTKKLKGNEYGSDKLKGNEYGSDKLKGGEYKTVKLKGNEYKTEKLKGGDEYGTENDYNSDLDVCEYDKKFYDDDSFGETSYQQLFEKILPSEMAVGAVPVTKNSPLTSPLTPAVSQSTNIPQMKQHHRPNSLYEQETGSYKSNQSNLSADSIPSSSEGDTSAVFTPLGGACGVSLIPITSRGLVGTGAVEVCSGVSDDDNSVNSYTQDVDETCIGRDGASTTSPTSLTSTIPSSSSGETTLTMDELRSAVLELSRARDQAEARRSEVAAALAREMETSSSLRAETAHLQSSHSETLEKMAQRNTTLTRENELLRHQLKKYVGAVQMLKRENSLVEGASPAAASTAGSIPSLNTTTKPEYRDYHQEASAYQSKLIQVAEMHGELMEFNERLHRLLRIREAQVKHLREQLVELRGPLPEGEEGEGDSEEGLVEAAVEGRDSPSSPSTCPPSPRTLINIWIPTAFLTGTSSDTHHVYQIYVRIGDEEWNVYRRYAQFHALHRALSRAHPPIRSFPFPQKKTFGYKDESVVEERRIRLQTYVRRVVNLVACSHPSLTASPDKPSFTSLLPFFSDMPSESSGGSRCKTGRRSVLSRFASPPIDPSTAIADTPQYNGL